MCDTNSSQQPTLVNDTISLDIAVLCQEYSPVEIVCNNNHIVELDYIDISANVFKSIFYPYGETFGLDKQSCSRNNFPYITFSPPYRSVCKKPFSLLEQIILNIETDLNVIRNCFTTSSLLELSKELSSIKTLCDLNECSILNSLSWKNIISIINNDYINMNPSNPPTKVVLIISIIFKTPNKCVLPTIIKFRYNITDLINIT